MKQIALLFLLMMVISAATQAANINWTEHIVGDMYTCWTAYAADVDGDGDMDVLGSSTWDFQIAWWENSGNNETFTRHFVDALFDSATSLTAIDFDIDGDIDIVATSLTGNVVWWQNNGSEVFTERIISQSAGAQVYDSWVGDIDGDGDNDVAIAINSGGGAGADIAWFRNDGLPTTFTPLIVTSAFNGTQSVYGADIKGDGDIDFVASSHSSGYIGWADNNGSEVFTLRTLETSADSSRAVYAADLDGDTDIDILATSQWDGDVMWFEYISGTTFVKHQADSTLDGPWDVNVADINGNGKMDIVGTDYGRISLWDTTGVGGGDAVLWWQNDGSENFTRQYIARNFDGAKSIFPIDFDGDGDMDVVASACWEQQIVWYESDLNNIPMEDMPVIRGVNFYTKKYPMGGQHGIPTIIQMQAASADTVADSIAFSSWLEFTIDGQHWSGTDSTGLQSISDTTVHSVPVQPNAGWNWFRVATRGAAACDSSGDVTAKAEASYDKNHIKR